MNPSSLRRLFAACTLLAGLPGCAASDAADEDGPGPRPTVVPGARGETPPAEAASAARAGVWAAKRRWPLNPVHLQVLPDGAVLAWGINHSEEHMNAAGWTDAWTWEPATGGFTRHREDRTNFFCAGHALLPDGTMLVAGGHLEDDVGTDEVTLFDSRTRTWKAGAARMNDGRWYPSVTVLENGEALILGGSIDTVRMNETPQVWTRDGRLRDLPPVPFELPEKGYPWTFLAPNGQVFIAGSSAETGYLSAETGGWRPLGRLSVPSRQYGSAVMYDEGRVLVVGGGDPPVATAEVIDLRDPEPRWRPTRPMSVARRQFNATLLADGRVLVTGGTSAPGQSNDEGAVHESEIWDPETETWTVVAAETEDRLYHSSAALLPDGRVVSGGGWAKTVQLYSPPYLFRQDGSPAVRPRVTAAPVRVGYGESFFVATPDAERVERATWIGLSSTTHAINASQRALRLAVEPALGPDSPAGVRLTAPARPALAPPGHYLLFLLDRDGVPSVGRIVRIG
jgi:hypothetical protein